MRPLLRPLTWSVAAAAAGLAWSVAETRAFTLRHATVPVLAPGSAPLRVLHLSDTHMTPDQRLKQQLQQATQTFHRLTLPDSETVSGGLRLRA